MVLDVLVERGDPIAFARTQVRPRLVEPDSRVGDGARGEPLTAALELAELLHAPGGRRRSSTRSTSSRPGSFDLHVIRGMAGLEGQPPAG